MKRQLLFLPCLLFFIFSSKGQSISARNAGLGSITSLTTPGEAITGNISGLTALTSRTTSLTTILPFGIPEVSTGIAAFMMPLRKGAGAISFSRFGADYYNLTSASLGYATKVEFVSLGMGIRINNYSISETGSRTNYILKFGGTTEVSPTLSFGAHIVNFSLSKVSKETGEIAPVFVAAGISWKPVKSTQLLIEAAKEIGHDHQINAGLEYFIKSFLKIRAGYSKNPGNIHFGIGLSNKKLALDYAAIIHPSLPLSHHLTIAYTFLK